MGDKREGREKREGVRREGEWEVVNKKYRKEQGKEQWKEQGKKQGKKQGKWEAESENMWINLVE